MYSPRVNDMSSFTIRIVGNKDTMTASIKCQIVTRTNTLCFDIIYILFTLIC